MGFDPAVLWESASRRVTLTEDGDQISEWRISLAGIRVFLAAG